MFLSNKVKLFFKLIYSAAPTTSAPEATTAASSSGSRSNGGCQTFNANECEVKCIKMDANGCLHCDCSGWL